MGVWALFNSYKAAQCNPRITFNKMLYISNKPDLFWKVNSYHCDLMQGKWSREEHAPETTIRFSQAALEHN